MNHPFIPSHAARLERGEIQPGFDVTAANRIALCLVLSLAFFAGSSGLRAGDLSKEVTDTATRIPASYEFDSNYSYVAPVTLHSGGKDYGEFSQQSVLARAVVSFQPIPKEPLVRLGVEYSGNFFDRPNGPSPLPNSLQEFSAVVGTDFQLSDSWLFRIEAHPGFYGDLDNELTGRNFDVPVVAGASYVVSSDLQWVIGVSVDLKAHYPVLPGVGVRWKFAEKWVLDAILPTPRLEYSLTDAATLYLGADLRETAYRVSRDFGDLHGDSRLNGAVVDFDEARVGVGASWKLSKALTLDAQVGDELARNLDFYRVHTDLRAGAEAFYSQISISGRF